MNMRFENKDTFFVSGFSVETANGETLEKDCTILKEKYEDILRSVSSCLYYLIWSPKGYESDDLVCHLGIESNDPLFAAEGATSIELPAACYVVATVPEGASIIDMWQDFYAKGIPSLGVEIDLNYNIHFEYYDENGVCELWVPVKA